MLVEAARTMLIFSCTPLFLWAEAIANACYTQNCSINDRKLDIFFLHVFRALCYPKNDHEDIRKLGAKDIPNTSQDVDELEPEQQHVQQQDDQAQLQTETIADNVSNAMLDGNTFVNPFAPPSTSAAESTSSQYVDPSNMHTFYQPYPYEYQWTKDHPLE
ncbi:hypothetical protein Tco_1030316 [Tanacetum coccineum]|uniref:Retrovirus-related Pol polyprotein from transposon TNT 1-94 n=1 Tax=Tanacetum coccineum TaxID=301880 RepID=A0ABQ5G5V9_9ASTR